MKMNGDHQFRSGRARRPGRSRRAPRYRSYANYSAPSSYKGSDHDLQKGKFDKYVDEFNSKKEVFNTETYDARVHAEADLMIALEAFKKEVNDLSEDFLSLKQHIRTTQSSISNNYFDMQQSNNKN